MGCEALSLLRNCWFIAASTQRSGKCQAGGKPSTWFPPEGLVEQSRITKSIINTPDKEEETASAAEAAKAVGTAEAAEAPETLEAEAEAPAAEAATAEAAGAAEAAQAAETVEAA